MNEDTRAVFRARIGAGLLSVQRDYMATHPPEEVLPEFIAALLSLAAFIAHNNANLKPLDFMHVAVQTAIKEWEKKLANDT
jgi:hypothetical protein